MILIKKAGDGDSKKIKGCWDSIHVVEVQEKSSGRSAHYKLTSTCMLWLQTNKPRSGTMNLGGSLTRQIEQDASVSEASPHIANIGIHTLYLVFTSQPSGLVFSNLENMPQTPALLLLLLLLLLIFEKENALKMFRNFDFFSMKCDICNWIRTHHISRLTEREKEKVCRP